MQIYILMSVVNYRRKVLRGSCKQMLATYVPTTVTIQQFLTSGTWTAPPYTTSVEYLVVGGGGGSGATHDGGAAGGGGGGMVLFGTATVLPGTAYTITVGAGGLGGIGYPTGNVPRETHGQSGGNSVFNGFIALGGSGGYASRTNGSGGGGTAATAPTTASTGGYGGSFSNGGGGGGGSSGNGIDGVQGGLRTGGAGGAGTTSAITGSVFVYGAGGAGATAQTAVNAVAGQPNTGKGAAAPGTPFSSYRSGAQGGSGIIILKYLV